MKKNISINISGIIFHIEEDGYDSLKRYLDSINRYFSTFEDSSEILADIESRIAEIFLSKLNEEKQVITSEDVNSLVATMGSVSDFKAAEETEKEPPSSGPRVDEGGATNSGSTDYAEPRKLLRDQKRKILGGVCAGLGNYFSVDPLWFRLLFAALLFVGGFAIIAYILMWIVIPGSYALEEPEFGKKMFRDPQTKVIGGVSGGLAAYFGIDLVLVRLLFVILTFTGGLGLLLYIILWVCLPEARTLTDKMKMQGEPVTLSNIESNIKRNFNIREGEEESTATRILLFPFRLLGTLLTALGRIIGPLADIVRVLIGVMIILTGVSMVFAILVSGGILFGLFAGGVFPTPWFSDFNTVDLPIEVFTRAFPGWTVMAGIAAVLVPSVFLILLGASTIAKRLVFSATVGWSLIALFFVSAAMLAVGIPKIVYSFRESGQHRIENTYTITGKKAHLKLNNSDSDYDAVSLTLRGHEGSSFRLVQTFEAQGSSRSEASENARMVEYNVSVNDSVFVFDEQLRFREDAVFRAQQLSLVLYIPYDFPFTMDYGISRFISQYVDGEYLDGYTWSMTRDGLKCLDCGNDHEREKVSDLRNFDAIEISGKFDLRILQGDRYGVEVTGGESARDQYEIRVAGETLIIEYEEGGRFDFDKWQGRNFEMGEMGIFVTVPSLQKIEATGLGTVRLEEIRGERLDIETRGPVKVKGDLNVQDLTIRLTGKSEADLSGTAGNMNARVEFASRLRAYELETRKAFVEAGGASSAKVHVTETLEIDEGVASDIDYRGNPTIQRHD